MFAEVLLTVTEDPTVRATEESLADLRSRHGTVQTLIAMANRFLRRGNTNTSDMPQKVTDHGTELSPIDIMVKVLMRISKGKIDPRDETVFIDYSGSLSTASSMPVADCSTQPKQVPCGAVTLSSMESEHGMLKSSVSNSSLAKKPLPPIGKTIDRRISNQD